MKRFLQLVMAFSGAAGLFGGSTAGALVLRGIATSDEEVEKAGPEAPPGGAETAELAAQSAEADDIGMDEPGAEEDPASAAAGDETGDVAAGGSGATGRNASDGDAFDAAHADAVALPETTTEPGSFVASAPSEGSVLSPTIVKFASLLGVDPWSLVSSDGGSGSGSGFQTPPDDGVGSPPPGDGVPGDGDPGDGPDDGPGEGPGGDFGGEPPDQGPDEGQDGSGTSVPLDGEVEVTTGRVTTLTLPDAEDAVSVEIVAGPGFGNVTVNPDLSLALVLTGETQTGALSFDYAVTHADGTVTTHGASLNAVPGEQGGGWGAGDFYMLETAADGSLVIEHGDVHETVYVTASEDGLSRADIAAMEGMKVEQVNDYWLADQTTYGFDEGLAVDQDVGSAIWRSLTGPEPSSHWLLLERGYSYGDFKGLVDPSIRGESELHPIYVGAYGEGAPPEITEEMRSFAQTKENVVVEGLTFSDGMALDNVSNMLLSNLAISGDSLLVGHADGLTLRNSSVMDVWRETPVNDSDTWAQHPNRVSGFYMSASERVLIENTLFDHNGWEDGYDYARSVEQGQPPSMYSHNIYFSAANNDVTLRDNIIMRAASYGAQFRMGGVVEDNVFLDNNGAINPAKGGSDASGNYSLMLGNLVTSAGYKRVDHSEGALSQGIDMKGAQASMVGNIIAHLADPNNAAEVAEKEGGQFALAIRGSLYFNDTVIYNWTGSKSAAKSGETEANIEGLDRAVLDQTTIQNFAADLLGKPSATISDLADYLRMQADGALDGMVDADLITAFFRTGFGMDTGLRAEETVLRFIPDDRGEGMRWDNRLNWSTDDLPGTQDGDSVDLGGNWVSYGSTTTALADLDLGQGGWLNVAQGRLDIEGAIAVGSSGGRLTLDGAGQFWTDGYADSDLLSISVMGGRFANTGVFLGNADLTVGENGQAILATDGAGFLLEAGRTLTVMGDDAKVGFDGEGGLALLRLDDDATLKFVAEDGAMGTIGEFRSGRFETSDVVSGVDLGEATLAIDLSGMAGAPSQTVLLEADELIGRFGDLDFTGLGENRNATVTIDYASDQVRLTLSASGTGTGQVTLDILGDESDGSGMTHYQEILEALQADYGTPITDPIAAPPTGASASILDW
ncbi:right-handed parallel beta-helix repeat-containing protein [Rhodovulum sulfidophilum]|uniref:right-handed parallel beta-helix repeat-containing protein n=1 Tax=Rhodovulum sulfidophilum TaxID=35806 RepID=UPI001F19D4E2|nr:right-handed parallel beta-helix repeat-containing protein [Rhodovulum sulfidophilum]MCE8440371.1 right-handed parallel beta-helix repeat-containing protein [Rhodovulum sulfidophilum]